MLLYDIEIRNAIPDKSGRREPGIQYAEGWKDFHGMDIPVVGAYDYITDRTHIFCADNLDNFAALIAKQECVVGFNNQRFDDLILAAKDIALPPEKSYDILQEVWHGLGLGHTFQYETHAGFSLGALCQVNFGAAKNGDGALAPILWQQMRIGTVIDYCLHDLHLTKKLLDRIIRTGRLINPRDAGQKINVRKPGAAS